MCCDPTYVASGALERLAAPGLERRPPSHRVLELGAVRLDAERHARREPDGRSHQHVIREHDVRRQQVAKHRRVRLDVGGALGLREVLEVLRLETLVPIEHEHGQETARQVGHDDLGGAEVEVLGRALLADDDDFVAGSRPFTRQRTGVDVRARAAEQVAVPEEDPQ